jgi:hypothetical protein
MLRIFVELIINANHSFRKLVRSWRSSKTAHSKGSRMTRGPRAVRAVVWFIIIIFINCNCVATRWQKRHGICTLSVTAFSKFFCSASHFLDNYQSLYLSVSVVLATHTLDGMGFASRQARGIFLFSETSGPTL